MLLIVPMASSFARMVRAGTPISSEKVRMVQGRLTTTLPFRGAAVFAPVRRMCVGRRGAGAPEASSSSPGRRWTPATRFRFSCRCSRPPRVAAPPSFSSATGSATRGPRRGRSRPEGGDAGKKPGSRGRTAAAFRDGPFFAASSFAFFSSCLRRCSESGLLPRGAARIASGGSLMSGRCGTGSFDFAGGWTAVGNGASFNAGCFSFSRSFSFSFSFSFSPPFGGGFLAQLLLRRRLLRLRRQHGDFAADGHAARGQVVLAAKTLGWGGQAFCRRAAGRRASRTRGPAAPDRHVCLQRRQLFVAEARQRRALPLDTRARRYPPISCCRSSAL